MKKIPIFAAWLVLAALLLAACAPAPAAIPGVTDTAAAPGAVPATATTAPTTAPTLAPTQATYTDPYAYCAAVGQIDAPDARFSGPLMTDDFFKAYLKAAGLDPSASYPDVFKKMTVWRCMGGKLYACNFGANIPCDAKANTDKSPTQALIDYCKANPGSDFIPAVVTGHTMVYSWHCLKDAPEILKQVDMVDAAGYQASFWQVMLPLK